MFVKKKTLRQFCADKFEKIFGKCSVVYFSLTKIEAIFQGYRGAASGTEDILL